MTQSQEELKKELHKHECRNIEIIYKAGKNVMARQDSKLLAVFIDLHDFELKMQKTVDNLYQSSLPIDKKLNQLREQLARVNKVFDVSVKLADKLAEITYVFDETSIEKLTESQLKTNEEIQALHRSMVEVYEDIKILEAGVNAYYISNEDDSNTLYDAYREVSYSHTKNREKNSIDIVHFAQEYKNFLSYRKVYGDRRRSLMNSCDGVLENYTRLNLENVTLYNVWAEFLKRCDLLRSVAALHSQVLSINNN